MDRLPLARMPELVVPVDLTAGRAGSIALLPAQVRAPAPAGLDRIMCLWRGSTGRLPTGCRPAARARTTARFMAARFSFRSWAAQAEEAVPAFPVRAVAAGVARSS